MNIELCILGSGIWVTCKPGVHVCTVFDHSCRHIYMNDPMLQGYDNVSKKKIGLMTAI